MAQGNYGVDGVALCLRFFYGSREFPLLTSLWYPSSSWPLICLSETRT